MRTAYEKTQINRLLAQNGLGQLEDPGLIPQLGFVMSQAITSHEVLRELLSKASGQERHDMYEAMRPYLRFEAKPLDVYIAETANLAERKQLPVLGADGTLAPFKTPELKTAQAAIAEAVAKVHLDIYCKQCTREASFPGVSRPEALAAARRAGWKQIDEETERCPQCLGY